MNVEKYVEVKDKRIGYSGSPCICTPLTGSNWEKLCLELDQVIQKGPDIIEWRADFFQSLGNVESVIEVAQKIQERAAHIPILFTIRSAAEGGQPISINNEEKVRLYTAVCASKRVDLIDFELCNKEEEIAALRKVSTEHGIRMILSHHNFEYTPTREMMQERMLQAEKHGADFAKIAVMPSGLEDVLSLLSFTLHVKKNSKIPLISISMGNYGALTRMFGWVFGSAFTFAIGENSSAPGQVPIEDLKMMMEMTQRILGEQM